MSQECECSTPWNSVLVPWPTLDHIRQIESAILAVQQERNRNLLSPPSLPPPSSTCTVSVVLDPKKNCGLNESINEIQLWSDSQHSITQQQQKQKTKEPRHTTASAETPNPSLKNSTPLNSSKKLHAHSSYDEDEEEEEAVPSSLVMNQDPSSSSSSSNTLHPPSTLAAVNGTTVQDTEKEPLPTSQDMDHPNKPSVLDTVSGFQFSESPVPSSYAVPSSLLLHKEDDSDEDDLNPYPTKRIPSFRMEEEEEENSEEDAQENSTHCSSSLNEKDDGMESQEDALSYPSSSSSSSSQDTILDEYDHKSKLQSKSSMKMKKKNKESTTTSSSNYPQEVSSYLDHISQFSKHKGRKSLPTSIMPSLQFSYPRSIPKTMPEGTHRTSSSPSSTHLEKTRMETSKVSNNNNNRTNVQKERLDRVKRNLQEWKRKSIESTTEATNTEKENTCMPPEKSVGGTTRNPDYFTTTSRQRNQRMSQQTLWGSSTITSKKTKRM